MAKYSKKSMDLHRLWMDRISRSKKVKKTWMELFRVNLIREYLDGRQKLEQYADDDWITINNLYSHLKSQLPALYSSDPYFYVKLSRSYVPDPQMIALWEKRGRIRASYLNYLKRELKLKTKARVSIQDAFSSLGCMKIRFHADIIENPEAGQPMTGESGNPLTDDMGNAITEPDQLPANERYILERIHPDDILFNEDAGPLEDTWGWIAQRIRMKIDDAKKDPKYKKAVINQLKGKGYSQDDQERQREERKKGGDIAGRSERINDKKSDINEPEIAVFWEIYDLDKKQWLVIAENADIPVMDPEDLPIGMERHPFAFLTFTLRDDSPYPHPPLSPLVDPAKEYNLARSDIQKHRKRFNRKYAASRQAFGEDTTEIEKIESGDDGAIAMVNGDARAAIAPITDAQLDPMRYNELSYLKAEMVELAGHNSSESLGLASAGTATQSALLDKRLEMKEGDAMSMVIDFITDIARKLDMLVQAHITKEEAVKITGPQGEFWELIRPQDYQDIQGEYEYTVNVGATIPRMPQVERSSWMAFLTLLSSFPQLALSKRLMLKMAEMHHIEDEAMVEEVYTIAKQMISGQMPMPGQAGSQAGVSEQKQEATPGGQVGGFQSLTKGNAAIAA
jgi:hypothetical protein